MKKEIRVVVVPADTPPLPGEQGSLDPENIDEHGHVMTNEEIQKKYDILAAARLEALHVPMDEWWISLRTPWTKEKDSCGYEKLVCKGASLVGYYAPKAAFDIIAITPELVSTMLTCINLANIIRDNRAVVDVVTESAEQIVNMSKNVLRKGGVPL